MTGRSSRCSPNRIQKLFQCVSSELTAANTRMLIMTTTNRKLVPQRGWKRDCTRTFSTVSGRPFS